MKPRKRTIRWERWADPYDKAVGLHPGPAGPVLTEDVFASGPVCFTPAGLVPVDEDNKPSAIFDLWVGHTDFPLDEETCLRMSDEPGVETFDVLTRYRFRLGVARQFQSGAVQRGVERAAASAADDGAPQLRALLRNLPGDWCLFLLPDGTTSLLRGDARALRGQADRLGGLARRTLCSFEVD